jgi:hypothetical protein
MTSVSVRRFGEDMMVSGVLQRLGDGEHRMRRGDDMTLTCSFGSARTSGMSHQRIQRTLLTPIDHVRFSWRGYCFDRAELMVSRQMSRKRSGIRINGMTMTSYQLVSARPYRPYTYIWTITV